CKNGDYYWVEANAAPIWENGKVVSYMSVRRKASPEAIAEADRIYRAINEGRVQGVTVAQGQIVSASLVARLSRKLLDSALHWKLLLLLLPGLIGMPALAAGALTGLIGGGAALISAVSIYVAAQGLGAWWFYRNVRRPVLDATTAVRGMAEGDFGVQVDIARNDEFGRLLQLIAAVQTKLGFVVAEVSRATAETGRASTEIAAGNQDLSARTEQQASSLEETASAMEELTATVKQNAESAKQANQLA